MQLYNEHKGKINFHRELNNAEAFIIFQKAIPHHGGLDFNIIQNISNILFTILYLLHIMFTIMIMIFVNNALGNILLTEILA